MNMNGMSVGCAHNVVLLLSKAFAQAKCLDPFLNKFPEEGSRKLILQLPQVSCKLII